MVLETGSELVEACALYARISYRVIEYHGSYRDNAMSICMEKLL